jgi:AraC family transcriptional regulator
MKSILKGFVIEKGEATAPPGDKHALIFDWDLKRTVSLAPANSVSINLPLEPLAIYFDPTFVDEVLEVKDFTFQPQSDLEDPFLLDVAAKLISVCDDAVAESSYAESLGVACVVHMAKKYGASQVYSPKGRLNPYQLKEVIDFAHSYMQFNIGLHEMAGLVHLSPYHFGRLFKQTVGKSPYQFILQLKIDCAKKLIKKNNGPISEVAYQLNFSDQSHFSNAFRKATGISPRQYLYS